MSSIGYCDVEYWRLIHAALFVHAALLIPQQYSIFNIQYSILNFT